MNERYTYLTDQRDDVEKAKRELEEVIGQITGEMRAIFSREFQSINASFGQTFQELFGGGKATLELEDPDDILNCGIEIKVQPPGKALKTITLLSGGEKAFVAIAPLFLHFEGASPPPLWSWMRSRPPWTTIMWSGLPGICGEWRKRPSSSSSPTAGGTMEEADVLYGVTMQEQGVSRMLTINLNDVEKGIEAPVMIWNTQIASIFG